MEIQQGLMLNLKCRVQGERDPDIRWYKDGQLIDPEQNPNVEISVAVKRSRLRVKNVQLRDSGNYSCIGSSENAELSRWVYVTVLPNTEERKAADETAYSPCQVNVCHVGSCIIIDKEPVCKCPPTHSGPKCSERMLTEPASAAPMILVTPNQDVNPGEEDFILDQAPAGSSSSQLTPVTDRCQLLEFQNSPECTPVKSHLYAFIGAAVVCSLIILLLGSCLGYIRRRKLLKRHLQAINGEKLHVDPEVVDISCNPETQSTPTQQEIYKTQQDSPIFSRTCITNSQKIYSPIQRGTSMINHAWQDKTITPNAASCEPLIDCSPNIGLNPTFVVLTSTAPLNIHPASNLTIHGSRTHSASSTNYMNHNAIPHSPGSLTIDPTGVHSNGLKFIPLTHAPITPTKVISPSTKTQPNPERRTHLDSPNLPCSSSTCISKQFFIQIPTLSTPVYLNTLTSIEKQIQSNDYATTTDFILCSNGSEHILKPPSKDIIHCNSPPAVSGAQACRQWDHPQITSPGKFGPDCVPVTLNSVSKLDPNKCLTTFHTETKTNAFQSPCY